MQPAQPQQEMGPLEKIKALLKQVYAAIEGLGGPPQQPPQMPPQMQKPEGKPFGASEEPVAEAMAAGAVEKEKTMPEVTAEEFAAVKAEADTFKAKADELTAKLTASETARRKQDWEKVVGDTFHAVPAKNADLVEKFMALEEKDAELSKFFLDLLGKADTAIVQSALFAQYASERGEPQAETFAAKIDAELKANPKLTYEEAMKEAEKKAPDMAKAYLERKEE